MKHLAPPSFASFPRPALMVRYVRSRLRSLDIERSVVNEVLDDYGLALRKLPQNLPIGRRSQNLILETTGGKKILKRYRSGWPVSSMMYGHSILTHLSELAYPAPRLVATTSGATFVRRDDGSYALFDFIDGTNYMTRIIPRGYRRRLAAVAGEALARFHRAMEGFLPSERHHLGFQAYDKGRWRDQAWHARTLKTLADRSRDVKNGDDAVHADWLARKSPRISQEIGELHEMLAEAPLPRRIIHGDYGMHNLLYLNDGTVAVTDFELSRLEWRLSDIVLLIPRFSEEHLRVFLAAYQQIYPFSPAERELLPYVWKFRKLQGAIQAWKTYFELDRTEHRLLAARKHLNKADWALENREQLLSLTS